MAIFDKHDNRSVSTSETTVIASGAKINGDFHFTSRLHVDGEIEGKIISTNVVIIGKKGVIKGELQADKLVVNGEFEGSADCSYVEVLAGGKFVGNVLSKELMIESKAYFQGQSNIRMDEPGTPVASKKEPLEAPLDVEEKAK